MTKSKGLVLGIAGAALLSYGTYEHVTRYDSSTIFDRQAARITSTTKGNAKVRENKFVALRGMLDAIDKPKDDKSESTKKAQPAWSVSGERSERESRCIAEIRFKAYDISGGDLEKAEKLIENQSYAPYEECSTTSQLQTTGTKWFNILGGVLLALGAFNFFRKYD